MWIYNIIASLDVWTWCTYATYGCHQTQLYLTSFLSGYSVFEWMWHMFNMIMVTFPCLFCEHSWFDVSCSVKWCIMSLGLFEYVSHSSAGRPINSHGIRNILLAMWNQDCFMLYRKLYLDILTSCYVCSMDAITSSSMLQRTIVFIMY